VTPEGVLQIDGVRKEDLGTYICSAVSAAGSTEVTARLLLTSQDQLPKPIISVGPRNQTLALKSMAAFPCETLGRPTPTTKWIKDGKELAAGVKGESESRLSVSPNGTLQITGKLSKDK